MPQQPFALNLRPAPRGGRRLPSGPESSRASAFAPHRPLALARALAAALAVLSSTVPAHAQSAAPGAAAPRPAPAAVAPPQPSALDAPLFYQLLIGEMELAAGQPGTAYEVILDAARRTRDDALFRRAVDIALQARAGEQALSALRAWRTASPDNLDAARLQLQILAAVNRLPEAADALRALLRLTPPAERGGLIAALPRFLSRGAAAAQLPPLLEDALRAQLDDPATRVQARVAIGRAWLLAGDADRALERAMQARAADPAAPGPVLLAMELAAQRPAADALVVQAMARPDVEPALRLAWVRALTSTQRYAEAVLQLEQVTRRQPDVAAPWLSLGALHLELKHPREGEAALLRYVELAQAQRAREAPARPAAAGAAARPATPTDPRAPRPRRATDSTAAPAPPLVAPASAVDDADSDGDGGGGMDPPDARPEQGLVQAWLMLAQSAEQRGDFRAAEGWLANIDDPQRAIEVQARRASILGRQGRVGEARALIAAIPERSAADGRAKVAAEAGLLRELKRWDDAAEVLARATGRFVDDADLLYEQAMVAEKRNRLDDMERLLRRVIELRPDNAHAHNALGYSLADRGLRLPEARALIVRALELAPGDPFITDSLGWVEYRLGNRDEALRLLRRAYAARPDPEIAAHLGEVLWSAGQADEARRVWREGSQRDGANEVLRETLSRLGVGL